jgi:hypothetical protein
MNQRFEDLAEVAAQGFGRESQLDLDKMLLEDQSPPANMNRKKGINHF